MNVIEFQDLGVIHYQDALALQEGLREKRIAGAIPDRILMLEHYPVFTMGKKDCESDLLSSHEEIAREGIEIVKCDRGGRVTYHGPGQLVCYFIVDIAAAKLGVKDFVHAVEEISLRALSELGVAAARDDAHPGLWVGKNKLVAVGLNISRNVSIHGMAMNVSCDLKPYRHVVACGIVDRGVTTVESLTGKKVPMSGVKLLVRKAAADVLGRNAADVV